MNDTPQNALYVSSGGSDQNDGSKEKPLQTLSAALTRANQRLPGVVFVAEGLYSGRFWTSVSIHGGYDLTFSVCEPARYPTTLQAQGPTAYINATLLVSNKAEVTLSGLCIDGPQDHEKTGCALHIGTDGRATLLDCVIRGGQSKDTTGVSSWGVASMQRCLINGGRGTERSTGIFITKDGAQIANSTIDGGSAPNSIGINGACLYSLADCVIRAPGQESSTGILAQRDSTPVVRRCTIETHSGAKQHRTLLPWQGSSVDCKESSLDGVPSEEVFARYQKIEPGTWQDGYGDVWTGVTIEATGYLHWHGVDWTGPSGGAYGGPSQTIEEFLREGPAWELPEENHRAILAMLQRAGFEIPTK